MALFFEMKFEQALPLFRQSADQKQKNAVAQTWLAETYRRLGRTDEALRTVRKALELSPCSSFAHLVLAQASYPDNDTIFTHVTAAIECDSTDPNAWLMMWGEAIRHADPALRNKCLRKLVETGFFTKAALAYGRAELQTLPLNAIFITNGDMDTYPAQAVQVTEGLRPDVAVIEREHLGIGWSYRFIRDHQDVPLPVSDGQLDSMTDLRDNQGNIITKAQQIFRQVLDHALRGAFQRPIALAPTLEEDFYSADKKHFKYEGMFLLWQPAQDDGIADTTTIRQCLEGLDPDDFTGPWASMKDRSPVRRYYTKGLVRVLSQVALTYSHELIKVRRFSEAERTLRWVEQFESRTELGPASTKDIERLREALNKSTR